MKRLDENRGKVHYQVLDSVEKTNELDTGMMSGTRRENIKSGLRVMIVLKRDQRSGKLTEGIVQDILTRSSSHPHGIKVRLESGDVGRVKEILE